MFLLSLGENTFVKLALGHLTLAHRVSKWADRFLHISKEWQTMVASSTPRARLEISPTKSILEPLYPDKKAMSDKVRSEAPRTWRWSTVQVTQFMVGVALIVLFVKACLFLLKGLNMIKADHKETLNLTCATRISRNRSSWLLSTNLKGRAWWKSSCHGGGLA